MAKAGKPNILILWGDDMGWWNISYNNRGRMRPVSLVPHHLEFERRVPKFVDRVAISH
jgi:arylsulfatase A-like enzyme